MGVFTYEFEFTSVIPPARLYNAFVLDADNLIPKIAPQAVKSTEILEGDGGVGTIKKINFGEGSTYSYVKHRIDGVDKDNFVYQYSVIEGDAISETIEKISYETKLVASGSGSIIKSISHYHTKGDVEIKEEHVKAGKEKASHLFNSKSPVTSSFSSNFFLTFQTLRRIMGVFTYESESTSVIPPARLFNATALDGDELIAKLAPQAVKSIEILEGDGGAGTIMKISFGESSTYGYVKKRIDAIDKENFVYKYSMIEGDAISETIEKISYETMLVASGNGSIIKRTCHYHTKGDVEIKEEHLKVGKEKASHLLKLVENYLLEHQDAYN
ncbi:unnamed protein product [Malus baccata var. baccata]